MPTDAPEGLCPECLLKQAMASDLGTGGPLDSADTEPMWYYVRNKQKVGPVALKQLQQLAASDELRSTDMLLLHGASKWVVAGTLPSLFPPSPAVTMVPTAEIPLHLTATSPWHQSIGDGSIPVALSVSQPVPGSVPTALPVDQPQNIGRYRIERVLGEGGFGIVYLAVDDELHRQVAIKVPHRKRIARLEDAEVYLNEARTVASLDHPHIVPVFDVGRTEDGLCFVVSKFIEGSDLANKLKEARFSFGEASVQVAVIAEALHHAHCRKLVHRDIKPANILIDTTKKPYLADFGLALKEGHENGAGFAGTPAYMSPEQIC